MVNLRFDKIEKSQRHPTTEPWNLIKLLSGTGTKEKKEESSEEKHKVGYHDEEAFAMGLTDLRPPLEDEVDPC